MYSYGIVCFTHIGIGSLVGGRMCSVLITIKIKILV